MLADFAHLAAAQGQMARAARLLGTFEAFREAINFPLLPFMQADHERTLAAARAALGQKKFEAEWNKGRALTREQAIAYALEDVPPAPPQPAAARTD